MWLVIFGLTKKMGVREVLCIFQLQVVLGTPWCRLLGRVGTLFSSVWNQSLHMLKTTVTFSVGAGCPFPLFLVNALPPLREERKLWGLLGTLKELFSFNSASTLCHQED